MMILKIIVAIVLFVVVPAVMAISESRRPTSQEPNPAYGEWLEYEITKDRW